MYQYSRAIYRSIKDLIEPYADRETQLDSRRSVLVACEQTMERLAADPLYFAAAMTGAGVVDGCVAGARVTTALAAPAAPGVAPGQATVDDVILSNAGLTDGAAVVVAPARGAAAPRGPLDGSPAARAGRTPGTGRRPAAGQPSVHPIRPTRPIPPTVGPHQGL